MINHHCPHCGYQLLPFTPLKFGNVEIRENGRIYLNGKLVHLTPTQFIIADALIRAKGVAIHYITIANLIGPDIEPRSVKTYILRVRKSFRQIDPSFDQVVVKKYFNSYSWVERRVLCGG